MDEGGSRYSIAKGPIAMPPPDPPSTPGMPVPAGAGPAVNYSPVFATPLSTPVQSTLIPKTPLPPYVAPPPPPEPLP